MIEVEGLTFFYKKSNIPALKEVSLSISKGKSVAIMGCTGAGKSTLVLTFNGIIPKFLKGKFSGRVVVDGVDTNDSSVMELSRKVGMVFQDFEVQLFSTNVELEVAFLPENLGLGRNEIKERVRKYVDFVGLSDFLKRQPAELSGGEKQRLAIASVLAGEPEVICLDEPTTDLDPKGKRKIVEIAKALQRDKDTTLIMIEHEVDEITTFDEVALMKEGEIIQRGKPEDVLCNVELLEKTGVRPPQVAELFYRKGASVVPVSIEGAKELFHMEHLTFDDRKHRQIIAAEENTPARGEPLLEMRGVSFKYSKGAPLVLKDVNLEIARGEYLAVLGSNGSGKTTLVKHFNGLLKPTAGDVFVDSRNTKDARIHELGRVVGYVFQNPDHQIFCERVWDEVAFSPKQLGFSEDVIEKNVSDALRAVGLEEAKDADPFSLTKGERQRVAVASALSAKTDVLIFDEPTTGLDYNELKGMLRLIKELHEKGHTIIIVTHSMWVAAENAKRVIVMDDGRIMKDGPTREVFSDITTIERASLKLPQISRFSLEVAGRLVLSVDEMLYCT